jgi:hypothetical protein
MQPNLWVLNDQITLISLSWAQLITYGIFICPKHPYPNTEQSYYP